MTNNIWARCQVILSLRSQPITKKHCKKSHLCYLHLMRKVERLQLPNGNEPFKIWINQLDKSARAKVYTYIDRVAAGGAKKNIKVLGEGVIEVKVNYGPGYRIYFGELDSAIILLLVGGDKGSQRRDIKTAKQYWRDYVQK